MSALETPTGSSAIPRGAAATDLVRTDPLPSSGQLVLLTLAVAVFGLACSLYAAWDQGWTYDEPYHVGWSKRLLEKRTTERRSTPLFNSKTPILVPNAGVKIAADALGIRDAQTLRFLTRLPTVGWFAATLAAVYVLGRRTIGPRGGCLATIAVALDPNWIAHGSLATADAAYGLATVLATGAGIAFARRPSWSRAVLLGLALGLAFTTKFTAFLLLPGLLLIPLAARDPRAFLREQAGRAAAGVVVAAAVAWLVVSGSYLFIRMNAPLSASRWRSPFLIALAARYPDLRVPLPADFLTGIDMCVNHERGRAWPVMLFGRRYPGGVWYYFLVLWVLKTPLLLLAAQVYGLGRAGRERLLRTDPALRYVAATLLVSLVYFSFLFRAQIGYRYVLMCLPLLNLLAAAGLASVHPLPWARWGALALLLLSGGEDLFYLGNPLAFTNAAVWPKREVYRLINDSNLGWGQNRMKISEWLADRGLSGSHLDPVHLLEGHNTFDVNVLSGLVQFERHRWVRENLRPGGHFGHTHVWFEVGHETYERFLNEARRLPPAPDALASCPADAGFRPLVSSMPMDLVAGERPAGWIVCVRTAVEVDLGLRVTSGSIALGPAQRPHSDWDGIERGQVAWYRLEPGTHVLGATTAPTVRAHWEVSGAGTGLHLRSGVLDAEGFIHPAPGRVSGPAPRIDQEVSR